jgi:hypothetical protein
LHVHLGQRGNERLLRPLIALEQLGRKPPRSILWHPQLDLADPGDQRARVVAGAIAKEPVFRVMNLMRTKPPAINSALCAYCARRGILALAGLDFGTERFVLVSRQALPNSQSIVSKGQPCTGATRPTSRVLADGNILRVDAERGPKRPRPPPFTLPTRRREHTIPSGFTVGPVRGIPAFVCREWSWDRSCVRAAPGPTCSCARTARFQSVRSARRAPAPGALHMIRYEVPALAP